MNVFLWVLQGVLALHTAMGAAWKLTNSENAVPSLSAIPHGLWLVLSGFELIVAVGLVLPALRPSLGFLAPVAAVCITLEMLLFSGLHLRSGLGEHGQMIYWLVVAVVCAFVAYGRVVAEPL
jgi:hypothetical protein